MKVIYIIIISLVFSVNCLSQNLLNNPESAVFDSQNNRYLVSNYGDGNIIQFDSLGQQTYFNQDCNSLAGMHIVGDTLFALDYQGENPGLVGLSLSTGDTLFTLHIAGMDYLNDITSDTSGNLYITDTYANKIFKETAKTELHFELWKGKELTKTQNSSPLEPAPKKNIFREYAEAILIAVVLALFIRAFILIATDVTRTTAVSSRA